MACSCVGFTQRRTTFEHHKANILQEHVNYSDFYATMIKSLYTGGLPLCWHFDFTKVVMGLGAWFGHTDYHTGSKAMPCEKCQEPMPAQAAEMIREVETPRSLRSRWAEPPRPPNAATCVHTSMRAHGNGHGPTHCSYDPHVAASPGAWQGTGQSVRKLILAYSSLLCDAGLVMSP